MKQDRNNESSVNWTTIYIYIYINDIVLYSVYIYI